MGIFKIFDNISRWAQENNDVLLDVVRIYLGVGLFAKGLQFVGDREFVAGMLLEGGQLQFLATAAAHFIPLAHIGGGFMLALGLLTRISVLFQLLPVAGAVLYYMRAQGGELLTRGAQDFEFTALVLFLLVLILIHGSGRLSLDHYIRQHQLEDQIG